LEGERIDAEHDIHRSFLRTSSKGNNKAPICEAKCKKKKKTPRRNTAREKSSSLCNGTYSRFPKKGAPRYSSLLSALSYGFPTKPSRKT
jgi:hypothetical protein